MTRLMLRKIGFLLTSVILMGISVTLFSQAKLGTDPYSCMNLGISAKLGMSFGLLQLMVNLLLLIFVFVFARYLINLGTLFNMVLVGFLVDFFSGIFHQLFGTVTSLPVRIVLMMCGVVLLALGASLYFTVNLGVSPYDATGFILTEKTKIHYRWCRIATDLLCVIVGFVLGSTVGVGTLITALFMGPLVVVFNKQVSLPLVNRLLDGDSEDGEEPPAAEPI